MAIDEHPSYLPPGEGRPPFPLIGYASRVECGCWALMGVRIGDVDGEPYVVVGHCKDPRHDEMMNLLYQGFAASTYVPTDRQILDVLDEMLEATYKEWTENGCNA